MNLGSVISKVWMTVAALYGPVFGNLLDIDDCGSFIWTCV